MNEPVPDLELAAGRFRVLHDDSRDGAGVTRDAYGPGEQRAHDRIMPRDDGSGSSMGVR